MKPLLTILILAGFVAGFTSDVSAGGKGECIKKGNKEIKYVTVSESASLKSGEMKWNSPKVENGGVVFLGRTLTPECLQKVISVKEGGVSKDADIGWFHLYVMASPEDDKVIVQITNGPMGSNEFWYLDLKNRENDLRLGFYLMRHGTVQWLSNNTFALAYGGMGYSGQFVYSANGAPSLINEEKGIWWEQNDIKIDLNGDKLDDSAILGFGKGENEDELMGFDSGKVYVKVNISGTSKTDISKFSIASNFQDAICSLPALLTTEDLDYPFEEIGFSKESVSKDAEGGLHLYGGECDSVHLFWNPKESRMNWWRH